MRVYNSFIASLALTLTFITVIMAAYHVAALDAYFAVYTIALLILTTLFMFFSPRARRALSGVSIGAFAGFMVVVALKVGDILLKR